MNWLVDFFIAPFVEFEFMARALVGSVCLALSATPIGILLIMRRLSLTGDAIAHAILPGAAMGYVIAGMSLFAMALGGFIAGVLVALLSGYIARTTPLREDASLAAFYLISLALGVIIVSLRGGNVDLLHLLFGSILALDNAALGLIAGVCVLSLTMLAIFYRAWILEAFDPLYFQSRRAWRAGVHSSFLIICVLNLVSGFHALGTLMAVGMMVLPGICAGFWVRTIPGAMVVAILIGAGASYLGLLTAFHANLPAGPCVILVIGLAYLVSILLGQRGCLASWLAKPAVSTLLET